MSGPIIRQRLNGGDGDWRDRATPFWADEFCVRHGINPGHCVWVEYDLIDSPLIRFGMSDEKHSLTCELDGGHGGGKHGEDCELATFPVERALVGALPDWWQPDLGRIREARRKGIA